MENQQPPQFTISELGAKFGVQQAQAFSEIITAEKIIQSLQAQIQNMAKREAELTDHIRDLEAELEAMRVAARGSLSVAADKIAKDGRAIINEKAALVEAALEGG